VKDFVFDPRSPQSLQAMKILPLTHFSEFCKIATRIQDRLIEQPLLRFEELSQLDQELVRWYEELPTILSDLNEQCPTFLVTVRLVMKWRYNNLRLVLHRPTLLSCALQRMSFAALSAEDKVSIGKCRILAGKAIEDISRECPGNLIAGWNAVWFVYQACMVPLVSLFSDASNPDEVDKWTSQIESALIFFERVKRFSVAAKRSQDAIAKLYEAFKAAQAAVSEQNHGHQHTQQQQIYDHFKLEGIDNHINAAMHGYGTVTGMPMVTTGWQDPPSAVSNATGFWDDMMWDTNFPDIPDNSYVLEEFNFNSAPTGSAMNAHWNFGHH
jgi:hypothetical protein